MDEPGFELERLLESFSLNGFADEDDVDVVRSSKSDQVIPEWQRDTTVEPGKPLAPLHTTRTSVHLQAERPTERMHHRPHAASDPHCWIGLSIAGPQRDVLFRRFGMVHWSQTPYITIDSQYTFPWTFQYPRAPLDSLNGVPECDTAETDTSGTLFYPGSLLPLPPW